MTEFLAAILFTVAAAPLVAFKLWALHRWEPADRDDGDSADRCDSEADER